MSKNNQEQLLEEIEKLKTYIAENCIMLLLENKTNLTLGKTGIKLLKSVFEKTSDLEYEIKKQGRQ